MNRNTNKKDREITKRLINYLRPYWKQFFSSLILILIVSASQLARPYLIKIAIDEYMKKGITGVLSIDKCQSGIKILCLIYAVLITSEFILSYFQTYILEHAGKKIIMNLREEIFNHIQRLPITYFDKNAVGRVVTRVTNDTDSLNDMFTDVVVGFLQNVFVVIGIVIIMLSLNLKLTVICLMVTPLMFIVTVLFKKKAKEVFSEIRNKLALINTFISEHISGIKIIQIFNMENEKYKEFENINKEFYKSSLKQIVLFGIFRPSMDVVKNLSLALILLYGGFGLIKGAIEVGTLYAFINYINRLFQPIIELTDQYNTYQSSMISAERIFALLDEKIESIPSNEIKLNKVQGDIEFKNVWFAYDESNWVLKDVSFHILPGESAAFVGATGAGKTSIVNLICGFYQHQRGEILIDGINIKSIRKEELRSNIGLVIQDVFLFSGDIETNVKLFNKNISLEGVKIAAQYVNADYFINNFNDGYKHEVNEKGTTLSMGQRQLLSFARAIVINPAILVMDEATSNIDTETEIIIQEAIKKLMKGRTSISIAHRLSTIENSDKIIVLNKGEIEEIGNHNELIKNHSLYYNFYNVNFR